MSTSAKTKWSQLRVGIMGIFALIILSVLVFLISGSGSLFKSYTEVYTYLDDSAAIAESAPVRLNGILVGKVAKVQLSGTSVPNRVVRVTMKIDTAYLASIPADSEANIAQETLLGARYINLKKGRGTQAVAAGSEIKSNQTKELADLFDQGYNSLAAMDSILKKLDGVLDSVQVGKGTIGKLLVDETLYKKIVALADESQNLVSTLTKTVNSDSSTLGRLMHEDTLYQDARGSIGRLNTLLDGLNDGQGTAGLLLKDRAMYDDFRKTIADVRELLAGINRGEGTVGKLLKSDDLHEQLKGTMAKLDTLMDKVNSGQGTLGQLLVNPALYESLDGTTREMQGLFKDFRANPKKFLRIKLAIF